MARIDCILVSYTSSFSNILLYCIVVGFIICLVCLYVKFRGGKPDCRISFMTKYRGNYFMALIAQELNSGQIIDIWAIHMCLLLVVYFVPRRESNFWADQLGV